MGTILKYIFYIVLIFIIYLVAKGIYDGQITKDTTVSQVGNNIEKSTQQLIGEAQKAIDKQEEAKVLPETDTAKKATVLSDDKTKAKNMNTPKTQ